MQVVTAETFGMWALQYLNASPMQAERCSGVPWAKPGAEEASRAATRAVPARAVRILVIWVSPSVSVAAMGRRSGCERNVPRNREHDCDSSHIAKVSCN